MDQASVHLIVRLLMAPGTRYEDRREEMRPFNRLTATDPAMREEVVALTNRATRGRRRIYILVNNKAEGSSPLTIAGLARMIADQPQGPVSDGRSSTTGSTAP